MSTTTTLTVNTDTRNYEPRWHEKYDAEYKKGDAVEVCELTDGDSIIRRSHELIAKGSVEKHFESVEDIYTHPTTGELVTVKKNITVTFPKGDVAARTRANDLVVGHSAAMDATRTQELCNGSLNR